MCIKSQRNSYPKKYEKFINLYQIKLDYDFLSLIHLCRNTRPQSWIDDEFIENYYELFKQGYVHTLELYEDKELIGEFMD